MITPRYLASDTAGMTVVFRWIEVAHGIDWLGLEMTRTASLVGLVAESAHIDTCLSFPGLKTEYHTMYLLIQKMYKK